MEKENYNIIDNLENYYTDDFSEVQFDEVQEKELEEYLEVCEVKEEEIEKAVEAGKALEAEKPLFEMSKPPSSKTNSIYTKYISDITQYHDLEDFLSLFSTVEANKIRTYAKAKGIYGNDILEMGLIHQYVHWLQTGDLEKFDEDLRTIVEKNIELIDDSMSETIYRVKYSLEELFRTKIEEFKTAENIYEIDRSDFLKELDRVTQRNEKNGKLRIEEEYQLEKEQLLFKFRNDLMVPLGDKITAMKGELRIAAKIAFNEFADEKRYLNNKNILKWMAINSVITSIAVIGMLKLFNVI